MARAKNSDPIHTGSLKGFLTTSSCSLVFQAVDMKHALSAERAQPPKTFSPSWKQHMGGKVRAAVHSGATRLPRPHSRTPAVGSLAHPERRLMPCLMYAARHAWYDSCRKVMPQIRPSKERLALVLCKSKDPYKPLQKPLINHGTMHGCWNSIGI